ncbi:MAG: tetratricopeptide repeat protein, partial [Chromatiales bacterium]
MHIGLRTFALLALLMPLAAHGQAGYGRDQSAERSFQKGMEALERGHFAQAYCLWEPLARHGHAEAQYNLGWLYANGNGMNVDIETAIAWWKKAAEQGHAEAQFALGLAYTTGESVGRDMDEAVRWYVAAASSGHEDARDIIRRMVGVDNPAVRPYLPALGNADWLVRTRRVAVAKANVRAGPGTNHKIVDTLTEGADVE